MAVEKFGNSYILGGNNDIIVSFDDRGSSIQGTSSSTSNKKYAEWFGASFAGNNGNVNQEPSTLLNLIANNNLLMPLLQTNIDFCLGDGVGLFKKSIIKGQVNYERILNSEIESWMDENSYHDHLRKITTDLYMLGNYASESLFSNNGKVLSVNQIMPTEFRTSIINNKRIIEKYFIGDWITKGDLKDKNIVFSYEYFKDSKKKPTKCIIHGKKYFPGQHHYGIPIWWGVKNWINLANQIPLFHLAGLTKGYNIRWHVQIPANYFEQFPEKDRTKEEEELMQGMDRFLSGANNAGKAFTSKYGQNQPEWKITALNAEIYDDAYKDIFMHSNTALSSANNIDPSLAGYDITGKLSSGSEKRNSYIIHTTLKTPYYRSIILKELNMVKMHNKWPADIEFKFLDTELQTLDVNKSGSTNVVQNSDTNAQ